MFRYQGTAFINDHGKALNIDGNIDAENRNINIHNKHGKINQQWDLVYVDQYPDEPTKGQLNKNFGFFVDRDFHIVSELRSHRYLEVFNGNNGQQPSIKTANGNKGQLWWFDQVSKTVKSRISNRSFDIRSSGKSNLLQLYNTNSGWW